MKELKTLMVGFALGNESNMLCHQTKQQMRKLLSHLNKRFPDLFPSQHIEAYRFYDTNEIGDRTCDVIICLGTEAYQQVIKMKPNSKIIKVNHLKSCLSKRKARINTNHKIGRIKTNYMVFKAYRDIEKQLCHLCG